MAEHQSANRGTDRLLAMVDGAPGVGASLVRGGLTLLSGIFWSYLALKRVAYAVRLARPLRLPAEVICIGNLSMGGTGKTLAAMRLARELTAAGKRVAILSRGYRRASTEAVAAVSTPERVLLTPQEAGDEPYLLARALPGVPVVVGRDRRRTGAYAVATFGADTLLLDDGFQNWRVAKDREIVLIDALQPPARERLFPRGLFREPWSSLARAQEVWITHARLADPARVQALGQRIAHLAPRATIRFTEHQPTTLRHAHGATRALESLRGQAVLALSGLGNPRQFEAMLEGLGAAVTPCRFPDHYQFTPDDLATIAAQAAGALVVTTAKDAARLPVDTHFDYWVVEVELVEMGRGREPQRR